MDSLAQDLSGPVPVALARAEDAVPGPGRMPGGSVYEPKWDGYRMVVVVDKTGAVRLWSRQGKDLTDRFRDVAAVATACPRRR